MGKRLIIGVLFAFAAIAFTFFSAEEQTVPVTGRSQRVALSDEQQQALGLQVYDQTLQQESGLVISSGEQLEQVRRVAERVAKVGSEYKPDFEWDFTLLKRDEANAFCLPGGKIVVYTGLLDVARTDAELATVVGHEVAHAIAEHGAERLFREQLTSSAVTAAAGAFADDPARFSQVAGLLGAGAQVGLTLPWGRKQESESDRIGLVMMARAGYDPAAAITFWQRMDKAAGPRTTPEYLATHPSGETRIRQIRAWLPEVRREARLPADET